MKRKIEDRIRTEAAKKVKVRITGRTRSPHGFDVWFKTGSGKQSEHAHSKAEALTKLLVKVQCAGEITFGIDVAGKASPVTRGSILTALGNAQAHLDNGDPVEAVSVLDLLHMNLQTYAVPAQLNPIIEDVRRYTNKAKEEAEFGSVETAEHHISTARHEARKLPKI